jgi:hypothetical protein
MWLIDCRTGLTIDSCAATTPPAAPVQVSFSETRVFSELRRELTCILLPLVACGQRYARLTPKWPLINRGTLSRAFATFLNELRANHRSMDDDGTGNQLHYR